MVGGMARPRTDALLAQALRLARKALEEKANAEDFEDLALVLLEIDGLIVEEGERGPKRWTKGAV